MPDTTPLPLPECPREDCPATIDHRHGASGASYACARQIGESCLYHMGGERHTTRCYAPRNQPAPARPPVTAILDAILAAADDAKRAHDQMCDLAETLLPAPQPQPPAVVLPTVDELARVIPEAWANPSSVGSVHLIAARAVLDLIAARLPVWQPVEPGTVIKAGTRVREVWPDDDDATEWAASDDFTYNHFGMRAYIDPRTVPAEPEDPRVAVVEEWLDAIGDAGEGPADLLARLDAMGADQ